MNSILVLQNILGAQATMNCDVPNVLNLFCGYKKRLHIMRMLHIFPFVDIAMVIYHCLSYEDQLKVIVINSPSVFLKTEEKKIVEL